MLMPCGVLSWNLHPSPTVVEVSHGIQSQNQSSQGDEPVSEMPSQQRRDSVNEDHATVSVHDFPHRRVVHRHMQRDLSVKGNRRLRTLAQLLAISFHDRIAIEWFRIGLLPDRLQFFPNRLVESLEQSLGEIKLNVGSL